MLEESTMPSDQDWAVQLLLKEFLYCAYTYLVFITVHILDQIIKILYPKKGKGVHIQNDYRLQTFTPSGTKPLPRGRAAEITARCLHDTNHHYHTCRKYKVQFLPLPQLSSTCLVCGVSLENTMRSISCPLSSSISQARGHLFSSQGWKRHCGR